MQAKPILPGQACTKFSNTTTMGKNVESNHIHGRVTLLPSRFFPHYALLLLYTIIL